MADIDKYNGVYYTPPKLADFLASLTIDEPHQTILDPAYGQCALLIAAYERLKELGVNQPYKQLYGYDIQPLNNCKLITKNKLDENKLIKMDFFDTDNKYKFDIILMNPPFVRHHNISNIQLNKIQKVMKDNKLPKTSDLWAYFLLYSLNYLKKDGNIAAILPWSFIQSDYAKILRKELYNKFETLDILIIGKHMFNHAQERILVFSGKKFGNITKNIYMSYSFDVPKMHVASNNITADNWLDTPIHQIFSTDSQIKLKQISNNINYKTLNSFADIKIGTVTGANSFFIIDDKTVKKLNIDDHLTKPIITKASELKNLTINKDTKHNNLLIIPPNIELPKSLKGYIKNAEREKLQCRYHTKKRYPWYSISLPKIPDAFIPYMLKEIPFITRNNKNILSTNSIHQIFFKDGINKEMIKWIQFSFFSSITQLSVELSCKTYGGGVLKLEPSGVKKILVYSGNGQKFPNRLNREIEVLLKKGNKEKVNEFVDSWMINNLNIPKDDYRVIQMNYELIRETRLNINNKSKQNRK